MLGLGIEEEHVFGFERELHRVVAFRAVAGWDHDLDREVAGFGRDDLHVAERLDDDDTRSDRTMFMIP